MEVQELIDHANRIKCKIKEKSEDEIGHMTYDLTEYLECIPEIDSDTLNTLLEKDIGLWKKEKDAIAQVTTKKKITVEEIFKRSNKEI